ncbi:MAG: hypothetical protein IIA60_10150 [Candidatus Marinimicrobia bacterium]|nr:hypothetical protein [Candidatus Neomarinimicrobiota bacterium]
MKLTAGLRQKKSLAVVMGIIALAAFVALACGGSAATPAGGKAPEAQATVSRPGMLTPVVRRRRKPWGEARLS